jgi:hypothetical protein
MLLEVVELLGICLAMFVYSSDPPENMHVEYIPGNTNLIFSVPMMEVSTSPPSLSGEMAARMLRMCVST